MNSTATEAPTRLIPVPQWSEYHIWPTDGGLRHLIFHAEQNGFNRVIKRVGRRVLIDEKAFFEWVDQQNESTADQRGSHHILEGEIRCES